LCKIALFIYGKRRIWVRKYYHTEKLYDNNYIEMIYRIQFKLNRIMKITVINIID